MRIQFTSFTVTLLVLLLSSCNEEERKPRDIEAHFYEFTEKYNQEIALYLDEALITEAENFAKETDEKKRKDIQKKIDKLNYRKSLGGFFIFKEESDLPEGLIWQDGMDEPEIGDPNAKKGGVFRKHMSGYPSTLRSRGKNSNNQFKSPLHSEVGMSLVSAHPITYGVIPGQAQRWALSKDGRTVYYHLHDGVTYNDGSKVEAWHYPFDYYLSLSDNIFDPSVKKYIKENFGCITTYGDRYVSQTLPSQKPYMEMRCTMSPAQPEFYKYYGPDYEEYYSWKPEPTTGPYEIKEGNFVKGVNITQTRVKNWWAKDMKYYRYRYNVDAISLRTIREENKAFEYFKVGELDYFDFKEAGPQYWYDKSEEAAFHNGYISKVTFYNEFPLAPRGLYLNVTRGAMKDRDVRIGVQHAMNWQKVIDVIYRGDYARLNQMSEGYGQFTNTDVKARRFEIGKAREYFAKAGYSKTNKDGFLENEKGDVLSLEITYASLSFLTDMMVIIQKEAKQAGLKIILRGLETTIFFRSVTNKDYQSVFMSFGISPPIPSYYNYYHSDNAFDEKGNVQTSTNNVFNYANLKIDELSEISRDSGDIDEIREVGHEIQQRIHDAAIFIPAYAKPFRRVAFQRWVEWPDTQDIQFNPPIVDEPHEWHIFWIDEEKKKKTLEAKRKGEKFPESVSIYDARKLTNPEKGDDE